MPSHDMEVEKWIINYTVVRGKNGLHHLMN